MVRVPTDYESDPGRWRAHDAAWVRSDPFRAVSSHVVRAGARPVLDVGGGTGALSRSLPATWPVVLLDSSRTQLREGSVPKVCADALALPVASGSIGVVTMLWMLYHLERPASAIGEAHRALRPGGLFAAATISRRSDPELTDGYEPTTFDAEEAPGIVASVFGDVDIVAWDGPFVTLPDRDAVLAFCRSHFLPAQAADRVNPPVTLTKRGCFVFARK